MGGFIYGIYVSYMNYELAKKLKDAGFPQNDKHYCPQEECFDDACRPSLSELIEACGKDTFKLIYSAWEWIAYGSIGYGSRMGTGQTSEEAVAHLWLELNKKP